MEYVDLGLIHVILDSKCTHFEVSEEKSQI